MSVTKIKIDNNVTKIRAVNNVNTLIGTSVSYIRTTFTSGDTIKEIGVIPINKVIAYTILEVTNAGSGIATVGTSDSQGLLLASADNDLSVVNKYINYNNIVVEQNQTINIYFTNNTASGTVTVYYN